MIDTKILGRMKVKEVRDNPDGTATIIFDVDKQFKEEFKKTFKLKRWSNKFFNSLLEQAIKNMEKLHNESSKKTKNKN